MKYFIDGLGVVMERLPILKEIYKFFVRPPKLLLLMRRANVFIYTQPRGQKLTGILLHTEVRNTGKATVVTDWSLMIIPRGMTPIRAKLLEIPETLSVGGECSSFVVRGADALDLRLKTYKVTGDLVEGPILFCAELSKDVVLDSETRFELTAKDLYGNQSVPNVQRIGDWPNDGSI